MLSDFEFMLKTKVAYGIDRYLKIGKDIKELTDENRAVLITDSGVIKAGLAEIVLSALKDQDINIQVFSDIQSDPTASSIDNAAELIRTYNAKCVIALGGGSVMDVAKMASLVASGNKPAMHYALMANPFPEKKIKSIMLPTTSGTGAEVTSTVVFSTKEKRKVWSWDAAMAPDLAILEPRFTVGLPRQIKVATNLDALIHAIEACTGKRSNPYIKALSMEAIKLISENFEKTLSDSTDLEAHGKLAIAATLAGMAIEQGGTGIAHCIGHALGTLNRVHHGRAVAIAMVATYKWNMEESINLHAKVAKALGAEGERLTPEELAFAGYNELRRLVDFGGIQLSLSEEGLSINDVDQFVEIMLSEENKPMRLNNCRFPSEEDLRHFALKILSANFD